MSVVPIKEAQELMKKLYLKRDKERGQERTFLKFVEEVGELAESLLLQDKQKISEEIADTLAWILSIANLLEVDATKVFHEKYNEVCPECNECPCSCKTI
ncbi:MAG: MazG nucleotide pyrophosphohydrolase domain-containing protein [Candidatus Heimdallarchaeaceae archaeon]|jgi:NTP pyrophosphatase (non-canonical NTP hydrolase)